MDFVFLVTGSYQIINVLAYFLRRDKFLHSDKNIGNSMLYGCIEALSNIYVKTQGFPK